MKNERINTTNTTINLVKAICAVLVVFQHFPLYFQKEFIYNNGSYFFTSMIGRVAVPFFYVVSGYYYNKALMNGKNALKQQGTKIIKLYIIWSLIYTPLNIYEYVIEGVSIWVMLRKYFSALLLFGTYFHFYYIVALLISMVLTYLFYKRNMLKQWAVISIVLYLIGSLLTGYSPLMGDNYIIHKIVDFKYFIFVRRYFFIAPAFFMLGYWTNAVTQSEKIKIGKVINVLCMIVSFILLMIEEMVVDTIRGANMMCISLYVFIFFLFMFCLNNPNLVSNKVSNVCKDFSDFAYFIHPLVIAVLKYFVGIKNIFVVVITAYVFIAVSSVVYSRIKKR